MGRIFEIFFEEDNIYKCKYCLTHITCDDCWVDGEIANGRLVAHLFYYVANFTVGNNELKLSNGVVYGLEIFCVKCRSKLGYKDVTGHVNVDSQEFTKERFFVQTAKLLPPERSDDEQTTDESDDEQTIVDLSD